MPELNMVYKYATEWEVDNPGAAYAQEFEDGYWGEASDSEILAGFQAACSGTASIEGQEDISSQSCTKFTCDFTDGSVSSYWISDSGWLVKGEFTSAEGYSYTMQYSNIDLNPTIDDSMFDIDSLAPGVPITEI
jgi:outer membrane lipoprotein-sorting protein